VSVVNSLERGIVGVLAALLLVFLVNGVRV